MKKTFLKRELAYDVQKMNDPKRNSNKELKNIGINEAI